MLRWLHRNGHSHATWPGFVAVLIALPVLLFWSGQVPPFGDEDQYGWSAAYFGAKLARLDLSPRLSMDPFADPGWAPSYWTLTQPMGTRLLFASVLGATGLRGPELPYSWDLAQQPGFDGPDHLLPIDTRVALRWTAIGAATLGLALIAWRLGWRGLAAGVLFLLMPNVGPDLALAYAEGPLVLGIGLAVAAYGTSWFGPVLGLAAQFKLAAFGLWPLMLVPGATGGSRFPLLRAIAGALLVWTLLEPPAWFFGGPLFILPMLRDRQLEYASQTVASGGFFPTRYLLPLELLVAILVILALSWLFTRPLLRLQSHSPRVLAGIVSDSAGPISAAS